MKIEVGMYVRTKLGIKQIYNIDDKKTTWKYEYKLKERFQDGDGTISLGVLSFNNIRKASYNIIDLIETGDYVNGHRIVKIFVNKYNEKKLLIASYREEDYEYSDKLEDYMYDDSIHIYEEDIKTILTKEEYNFYCYEIDKK